MIYNDAEILTVEELAELLYINRNMAYDLCRAGDIRAFKIGRVWKVPRSAITEYIERKMVR